MNPRIFVLNKAGHDYSPAYEFGTEIIALTTGNLSVFDIDRNAYTLIERLIFHKFNPDVDYIVLSGNLVLGFTFGAVMGKFFPKFKALFFNARDREYKPRDVNINSLKLKEIKEDALNA